MKYYDNVIKYLELAYKNCSKSDETENLRILIKHTINGFEKINKKNKKIYANTKLEGKKVVYPFPEQTIQLIDNWIEGVKNEIDDN